MTTRKVSSLEKRLVVQCIADAKHRFHPLNAQIARLEKPDSEVRVLLSSIAQIMDKELKNLAKRMNRKIEEHSHFYNNINYNAKRY
jgi:hypothetical protein